MTTDTGTFRFSHPVAVRFKDIDIGGHAHHSHALVYFEEARAAYWRTVAGRQGIDDIDYILAEAGIRYHRRVLYPGTLTVEVRVPLLGKKHFVMEYRVSSADGELLLSGRTTQVMYDYQAGSTARIPAELRRRIEVFESGETE
jgi:acyl-CoA thioester hydrolase